MNENLMRVLVKPLLIRWRDVEWTLQGLGMFRTYLDQNHRFRLHVWHSKFKASDVSEIHDHPWDFESYIVSGWIRNTTYKLHQDGLPFQHIKIECGCGGGPMNSEVDVQKLKFITTDHLKSGMYYKQSADEIHLSEYGDGTITICDRVLKREDNHAHIFWKSGPWVSAEPRPARSEEVEFAVKEALKLL